MNENPPAWPDETSRESAVGFSRAVLIPHPSTRARILVDNAARLYGFASPA
jgi:predicted TIM-barrel fold metal-dependent hydrolase